MTTRAQLVAGAFEALGLASYVFDLTPGEQASAYSELDDLMGEWEGDGLDIDYAPGGDDPAGSDVAGVPTWATGAVKRNLALRLAPGFGKTASPHLIRSAKTGLNLLRARTLTVPAVRSARVGIRGGGDRRWYAPDIATLGWGEVEAPPPVTTPPVVTPPIATIFNTLGTSDLDAATVQGFAAPLATLTATQASFDTDANQLTAARAGFASAAADLNQRLTALGA